MDSMSGCNNPFTDKAEVSSSSKGAMLDDRDASSNSGIANNIIDVSSGDEEDI
jgi:hypothetical protein